MIRTNQKTTLGVSRRALFYTFNQDRLAALVTSRQGEAETFGSFVERSCDNTTWSLDW